MIKTNLNFDLNNKNDDIIIKLNNTLVYFNILNKPILHLEIFN
tara:strand:+ start:295 stop:423 length:129 start_codon:yes stop_codon:yes gene_type:complete